MNRLQLFQFQVESSPLVTSIRDAINIRRDIRENPFPYNLEEPVLSIDQTRRLAKKLTLLSTDAVGPYADEELFGNVDSVPYRDAHSNIKDRWVDPPIVTQEMLFDIWAAVHPTGEDSFQRYHRKQDSNASRFRNTVMAGELRPPHRGRIETCFDQTRSILNVPHEGIDAFDAALRVMHSFTWTHGFPNGNGRFGFMSFKVKLVRSGFPVVQVVGGYNEYIAAMNKAHNGNLGPLADFMIDGLVA